jgi:hypothetical protein
MTQLSRPFQIALLALAMFALVWFVALRGHSGGSSPRSPASAVTPTPAAASGAQKAATPTPVYHGSAPGVEGLTRAIAKAHGAVAQSQQNAKQLEEKSAQASNSASASAVAGARRTPSASATSVAPKSSARPSTRKAARGAGDSRTSGSHRIPARQALVETALKQGKIALVLFWNKKGADDVAVHDELRLLEAFHHLIRQVAGVPEVRKLLKLEGLDWAGKIAVFEATSNQVTSFGAFTRNVQVYQTPTLLIINRHGQTTTLTGLTDYYSIQQAIAEARRHT